MPDVRCACAPAIVLPSASSAASHPVPSDSSRGRPIPVHILRTLRPIGRVPLRLSAPRPPERSGGIGLLASPVAFRPQSPPSFLDPRFSQHRGLPAGSVLPVPSPRSSRSAGFQTPRRPVQHVVALHSCEAAQGRSVAHHRLALSSTHSLASTAHLTRGCTGLASLRSLAGEPHG